MLKSELARRGVPAENYFRLNVDTGLANQVGKYLIAGFIPWVAGVETIVSGVMQPYRLWDRESFVINHIR